MDGWTLTGRRPHSTGQLATRCRFSPRAVVVSVGAACGDPCWRSDSPFDVSTDRCRRLDSPSQATRSFVGGPITRDPHGGDVRRPPSRGDSSGDVPYSSIVSDELRTSRACVRHTRVTPKGWRRSSEEVERYRGRASTIFLDGPRLLPVNLVVTHSGTWCRRPVRRSLWRPESGPVHGKKSHWWWGVQPIAPVESA